jgi:endoglucanase
MRPDGSMLNGTPAMLPLVASAAAAKVAGHRAAAGRLLRQGPARQRSHPAYYGGAWQALGSALLTSRALGSC